MPGAADASPVDRVIDGRYRVQSHLADGGMASVYRAVDLRLDRDVALKIMRPDLARDEEFVRRFRREARAAAQLSHPHVVGVFDQGSDEPYVFLAMELVEGRNLREVIQQDAPLAVRGALDIMDPVLQALEAAHQRGIVHRDVKPENVILRQDGTVKVADFGLARAVTTRTMTSNADILLGTAAYLSPEQVERGTADARSDVYAAGLLLHEMLTGAKAFPGDSPIHVAYQHVHGQVPAASEQVATVPAELDGLIALATARDPDQRPATAGELLTELRRVRAGLGDEALDSHPRSPQARPAPRAEPTVALGREHTRRVPVPTGATAYPGPTDPTSSVPSGPASSGPSGPAPPGGHYARTEGNRPRRRPRRRAGWALAVLLLLGAVGAGATWYFTAGPAVHSRVPPVVGMQQEEAVSALVAHNLDAEVVEDYHEQVPAGEVMAASPEPGVELRHGDPVELTVSLGPERYEVPDLVGSDRGEARELLEEQHLVVGEQTEDWDEDAPVGEIISTSPEAGTEVRPQTAVHLVVSAGPEPITVPDVTGRTESEATEAIEDAELEVSVEEDRAFSDSVPEGSVVSQDPASGTLHRGDTVTLTISRGPELVEVPDVFGDQYQDARTTLEEQGFVVEREDILGAVFGTVRSQDPEAGTQAPRGSTVTVRVL